MKPERILITGRQNGVGLETDARILEQVLADHAEVSIRPIRSIPPWQMLLPSKTRSGQALIYLERIFLRWHRHAEVKVLFPNQERYPERLVPFLRTVDHICCKSRHATEIFARLHPSVHYVGFSSPDQYRPEILPDFDRYFHLAGRSTMKGTEYLIRVWEQHPEWPELTIVCHPSLEYKTTAKNLMIRANRLSDEELIQLQTVSGVHLCPSLCEGWGHYIVEALSSMSVVLTLDAPPMNEIIQPDRGILVGYADSRPRRLGTQFTPDIHDLEAKIARIVEMPIETKQSIAVKGREWFLSNQIEFRKRLVEVGRNCGFVAK